MASAEWPEMDQELSVLMHAGLAPAVFAYVWHVGLCPACGENMTVADKSSAISKRLKVAIGPLG